MTYVDGLASGINASQMITSLMAAERVPQQQLNSQRTTLNRQQSAFNDVKDLYKAALAKVQNLADSATWNAKKATSSNDSVAATVTSDALTTQITFNVTQTAAAHSMYTNDVVQADDIVATSGRFAGMTATEAIDDINNDDAFIVDRNIDVHIASLRKKLGPTFDFIDTVRGVGYRFREETVA